MSRKLGPPQRSPLQLDWTERAACKGKDRDLYFPEQPDPNPDVTDEVIRETCLVCPVRKACLHHALTAPEDHGIWGGLTELERKLVRKELGLA